MGLHLSQLISGSVYDFPTRCQICTNRIHIVVKEFLNLGFIELEKVLHRYRLRVGLAVFEPLRVSFEWRVLFQVCLPALQIPKYVPSSLGLLQCMLSNTASTDPAISRRYNPDRSKISSYQPLLGDLNVFVLDWTSRHVICMRVHQIRTRIDHFGPEQDFDPFYILKPKYEIE